MRRQGSYEEHGTEALPDNDERDMVHCMHDILGCLTGSVPLFNSLSQIPLLVCLCGNIFLLLYETSYVLFLMLSVDQSM